MSNICSIDSNFPIEVSNKVYVKRKPTTLLRQEDPTEALQFVGASLKGQDVLRGLNFDEAKVYLKDIIGVSPERENWEASTKEYWANIRVHIPHGMGRELEIGFAYKTQEDKEKGEKGDYIVKQQYGRPINISDYIVWRYCLVYKRVSKTLADVNKSVNIKFYLYSKAEENATKLSTMKLKDLAIITRIKAMADRALVNDILALYDEPIENMSNDEKDIALEKYATATPQKFIDIASSPTIKMKSFIERCIRKGFLRRLENTDTIVSPPNKVLGSNIEDAVIFLERPTESMLLNTLKAKMQQSEPLTPFEEKKPVLEEELLTSVADDKEGIKLTRGK